jgi:GT2 family glycosyltransferase
VNNISIICSNYNSDRWIDEYFSYVNNQKDASFDIIFIDAKSTDDSLNKIKKFEFNKNITKKIIELDSRVGVYEAWNIGIKNSNTPYVMNYNTDDMIFDYALYLYNSCTTQYPNADIIYGPCGFVESRDIKKFVGFGDWPEYSHDILTQMCICGPFPLVKKQAIEDVGFFNESFVSSGDYEMWLKMSKAGKKFQRIPQLIGSFFFRPDSVHSANAQKARQEDLFIQAKYK